MSTVERNQDRDQRTAFYTPEGTPAAAPGTAGEVRMERETVREREMQPKPTGEWRITEVFSTAAIPATCGAVGIILGIVGLADVHPGFMMTIAMVILGVGLLFEGAAVGYRFSTLLDETGNGRLSMTDLGGGATAEFLGGAAGIVLGILGVMGIVPATVCAVATIVFGVTLLLSSATMSRLNRFHITRSGVSESAQYIAREIVSASSATQVLVGVAAVILGILALVSIVPMTLVLAASLCVGGSLLLTGASLGSRMLSMFPR